MMIMCHQSLITRFIFMQVLSKEGLWPIIYKLCCSPRVIAIYWLSTLVKSMVSGGGGVEPKCADTIPTHMLAKITPSGWIWDLNVTLYTVARCTCSFHVRKLSQKDATGSGSCFCCSYHWDYMQHLAVMLLNLGRGVSAGIQISTELAK